MGVECKIPIDELNNKPVRKVIVEQPMIIIPIPSPTCNEKWNYNEHGNDWDCKCKEGKSQSPIDLPVKNEAIIIKNRAALFEFRTVNKDEEKGMLNIVLEEFKLIIHV